MAITVIEVNNLGKRYYIGKVKTPYKTLSHTLQEALKAPFRRLAGLIKGNVSATMDMEEEIWALKDISFKVNKGEVLGVIGHNGSGKSTLLKILSRITDPTQGRGEIRGHVGSLLEVGTGFHHELTGRENIFLNGALLGMGRKEIVKKFDQIVDFAEIGKFLDTPVKFYSSGMYIRLAFAVAAHLDTEILLIDEVLAVGDVAFQKKCLGRMSEVAREGRTVLFVSHNMLAVQNLCTRGILLNRGRIEFDGNINNCVEKYLNSLQKNLDKNLSDNCHREGDGRLRFTKVEFVDNNFNSVKYFVSGSEVKILLYYKIHDHILLNNVKVGIDINNDLGIQLTQISSDVSEKNSFDNISKEGCFVCSIPRLALLPGRYTLNLFCIINNTYSDLINSAVSMVVESGDFYGTGRSPHGNYALFLLDYNWSLQNRDINLINIKK